MEWLTYLLKVSVCMALFFAFYLLVLRRLTFFKINRFYLLFSLLLSFIIPALQFTIEREIKEPIQIMTSPFVNSNLNINQNVFEVPITVNSIQVSNRGSFNWLTLLPYIYGVTVLCLLLLTIWRLFQLLKHTRVSIKKINGLKLVVKRNGFTNCSFFNYVFIDKNSLTKAELAVLLAHEEVHVKQYHSVDKLLMMIAKAFLWFNPIIYLYDRALEQEHEYEADAVAAENVGVETYAKLLLGLAVSKSANPFIHNLVKSPIKQRIKVLFNPKSKNMKKISYVLALPIALSLVWLLATEVVYANGKTVSFDRPLIGQDKPFIKRAKTKDAKGHLYEEVTINSPGKPLVLTLGYGKDKQVVTKKIWFFINDKLYTEAEAQKFNPNFVNELSTNRGGGGAINYDLPAIEPTSSDFIVWFGKEPKLSTYTAKNKAVYEKYNGTTVSGTVIAYSYSSVSKTLMDGFIIKTNTGELLKAFVEAKFAKQTSTIIKTGDEVTIKIYNLASWRDTDYPVISSYKLIKDDKVLFDRWPKTVNYIAKAKNVQLALR